MLVRDWIVDIGPIEVGREAGSLPREHLNA